MKYLSRWALAEKTVEIIDRYNEGIKLNDMAIEFQVANTTIRQALVDAGVEIRPQGGQRKHSLNESFFESIDSEEKAYWVGFILADGCIIDSDSGFALSITLSHRDRNHLDKFKSSIDSSHKITTFSRMRRNSYTASCMLNIRSAKLCNDLIKLNVTPRKTYDGVPAKIPNYLRRHYFRGLIDGDGSISKSKSSLGYALRLFGTKAILKDFSRWLGLRGKHIHEKRKQHGFEFSLGHQQKVIDALERIYGNSNIYLDRKYTRYEDAIERWYDMPNKSPAHDKDTGDFIWIPQPKQLRFHF